MTIYLILIALSAVIGIPLCGMYRKKNDTRAMIYCIIFGIIFTVLFGIRLSVGIDYNSYATVFYEANFQDYEGIGLLRLEKGILFPAKVVEIFTFDYFPCFVLMGFIVYIPVMVYAAKYSDNPWIGVFAFLAFGVYFNSLNFMRQIIAAIICAFAFKYAERGTLFRFLITVLIGTAFHRSALIVIPCFFLSFITMNLGTLILALMTTVSAYILSEDILIIVLNYLSFYKNYSPETQGREVANGLDPMYAIMFGTIFVIALIMKNKINASEREKNILLWSAYAAFFFEFIGTKHAIVSRVAVLFFFPVTFILIPKLFIAITGAVRAGLKGKAGPIGSVLTAAALMLVMCFNYGGLLSRNYNGVVPYRTIWERN